MRIPLSNGGFTLIDDEDAPLVAGLTIYRDQLGYATFSVWGDGRNVVRRLHTHLMQAQSAIPAGMMVDHINGDQLDNRRSANLRVVTGHVNQVNRHRLNRNNTSGVRGVARRKNRWIAQITVDRRNLYLGLFRTKEEAIEARRAAELQHYGEYCPCAS